MEAGPQGPQDPLAEKGNERLRAGRTQQPELPLNWNSAKSKSWLEWSYRHSQWKPRDQGLSAEQRPRTARPNRGKRPNSGAASPGLNGQPQTARPARPVSSLSNRQGWARQQGKSAQTGIACQQRDANVDRDKQKHDDEPLQKPGKVLMLPCKLSSDEPTAQKQPCFSSLLSGQTSSATEHLEALAVACVDEVSAVETRMRSALSTRYPKAVQPMPKHKPYVHHKSGDFTPRAPASKHVDTGLPAETDQSNKRASMFKTRVCGTLDETISASATHKRLQADIPLVETTMCSMTSKDAARFALAAGRQLVEYTSSVDPLRMRKRSSSKNSLSGSTGGSPASHTASKNRKWRTGRRGVATQHKASLRGGEEIESRIQSAFAGTAAQVRKVENVKQQTLSQWELQQIAIQLAYPFSEVQYAKKVFDELDANQNGSLDYIEFEKASVKMVGEDAAAREVRRICREVWTAIADGATKTIGFQAFLSWYVNQKFCTDTKPSHSLAHQNNVTVEMVEYVMRSFEAVDTDKSGFIDMQEFAEVLYKIMRIPLGVELPASRVQSLWMELETSGDSKVSFEEFLPWWLRRKDTLLPYDGFYSSIRRVGKDFLDPPAYHSKVDTLVD